MELGFWETSTVSVTMATAFIIGIGMMSCMKKLANPWGRLGAISGTVRI
jgi:hypothetical protein